MLLRREHLGSRALRYVYKSWRELRAAFAKYEVPLLTSSFEPRLESSTHFFSIPLWLSIPRDKKHSGTCVGVGGIDVAYQPEVLALAFSFVRLRVILSITTASASSYCPAAQIQPFLSLSLQHSCYPSAIHYLLIDLRMAFISRRKEWALQRQCHVVAG